MTLLPSYCPARDPTRCFAGLLSWCVCVVAGGRVRVHAACLSMAEDECNGEDVILSLQFGLCCTHFGFVINCLLVFLEIIHQPRPAVMVLLFCSRHFITLFTCSLTTLRLRTLRLDQKILYLSSFWIPSYAFNGTIHLSGVTLTMTYLHNGTECRYQENVMLFLLEQPVCPVCISCRLFLPSEFRD